MSTANFYTDTNHIPADPGVPYAYMAISMSTLEEINKALWRASDSTDTGEEYAKRFSTIGQYLTLVSIAAHYHNELTRALEKVEAYASEHPGIMDFEDVIYRPALNPEKE